MQKTVTFFSLQIIANQRGKVKKKIVLFSKKNTEFLQKCWKYVVFAGKASKGKSKISI